MLEKVNRLRKKYITDDSFVNHSVNYLIERFGVKGLSFIAIPIFTFLLSPDEYGQYVNFTAFASIFSVIWGINISSSLANIYLKEKDKFNSFLGSALLFTVFINILFIIVVLFLRSSIINAFSISEKEVYLLIFFLIGNNLYNYYIAYLKASQNSKQTRNFSYIKVIVTLAASIIIILSLNNNKYLGRIYGDLIGVLIIFIMSILPLLRLAKLNFKYEHIVFIFSFGFALIPYALSNQIIISSDRILIKNLCSNSDAGLYGFAYNISLILSMIINATNAAWIPIFFKNYNKKQYKEINKKFKIYTLIVFYVILTFILFNKEFVQLISNERFHSSIGIIHVLAISHIFIFLFTIYSQFFLYKRKIGGLLIVSLLSASINIILNYLLIPQYGYKVAAFTTLISYFILSSLLYLILKYKLKVNFFSLKRIIPEILLVVITYGVYVIIIETINNNFIEFLLKGVVFIVLSYFAFQFFKKEKNGKRIRS